MEQQNNTQKEKISWNEKYKWTISEPATFKEIKQFTISLTKIFWCFLFFILTILIAFFFLIKNSPLKNLIKKGSSFEDSKSYKLINDEIFELKETLEIQKTYISALKNMITTEQKDEDKNLNFEYLNDQNSLNKNAKSVLNLDLIKPISGTISSRYNKSNHHLGIDIVAKKNSQIYSVADGIIISADWNSETGHTLIIQHAFNLISCYKHNSSLLKKSGDRVKKGDAIAIIGNSGELSDGPHLHFETWLDGNTIDPEKLIQF